MINKTEQVTEETIPRATPEVLWEIHRNLTEFFLEYLEDTKPKEVKSQILAVIRSFLVDNEITYANSKAGLMGGLNQLVTKYPFDS